MAAAVIIAGGRGTRLGGALKSELRIGGERLLDRVGRALTIADPMLVAHGMHPARDLHLRPGMIPVADLDGDYGGPLAGVAASVAWLNANRPDVELLVAAAVDTPFLPEDFPGRLLHALAGGADAAVASSAGQPYPTNSAFRLAAIRDLPQRVRDGTSPRSLKALAAGLGAVDVAWPPGPDGDPFANINEPGDLEALERRLG